jgi:hypothetical protein
MGELQFAMCFLFLSMTLDQFKNSLSDSLPSPSLSPLLKALWYDGKEEWEQSHTIAQGIHTKEGSWVHAYLHRKEGDEGNAMYWYNRAGKKMPEISLSDEWEIIVSSLLRPGH